MRDYDSDSIENAHNGGNIESILNAAAIAEQSHDGVSQGKSDNNNTNIRSITNNNINTIITSVNSYNNINNNYNINNNDDVEDDTDDIIGKKYHSKRSQPQQHSEAKQRTDSLLGKLYQTI